MPSPRQDITFKGYSQRTFGHWTKHILLNVQARLTHDPAYTGDPSHWVHPGSYRTIYKWVESQKQQYSDANNARNKTGSAAPPLEPQKPLQKARMAVWKDNARCNFPRTTIESSAAPPVTVAETSSEPRDGTPLSDTANRNSDGRDMNGDGVADLFGDLATDDLGTSDPWSGDSQQGDLDPEAIGDDEAEAGFSQNSTPIVAGNGGGGNGGSSEGQGGSSSGGGGNSAGGGGSSSGGGGNSSGGGGSSSGGGGSSGASKGKGKAPQRTPPRSRGRDGRERKQLERFNGNNLNALAGGFNDSVSKAAEVMGGSLKDAMGMIASMMAAGGGAAGGGAAAGGSGEISKKEKLQLCLAVDSQYGGDKNRANAQKLLEELL